MPRLSTFYGIVVWLYYGDHEPAHVHARYAGAWAAVAIETGAVLAGEIPPRAERLLIEWMELHRSELLVQWERAVRGETLTPIAPLQ